MSFEIIPDGLEVDQTKFQTCQYRSSEEVEIVVRRCCGQGGHASSKGYRCNLFAIDGITATTCVNCAAYQKTNGTKR